MRVLVTGAGGFVGRVLCARLAERGHTVRAAVRAPGGAPAGVAEVAVVGEIGPATEWGEALRGVDAVIHLAARVHVMDDRATDPLAEYRRTNVGGTERLARQAAEHGVRRLVFASSIKVLGEATHGAPFREETTPAPADPYGVSKREAEAALRAVEATGALEVCVVRPPLVYGPGVKANFARLMGAVARGVPLPLGALRNRRSLVYVGNLADALVECAAHPAAAGETFLVADEPALTPAELVRAIAGALGRPARLLPVAAALLRAVGRATGRTGAVDRLAGSLEVDSGRIRRVLRWTPPFTTAQGLAETARWFRGEGRGGG
jgi:nucleoside-diphosphate-sugar epimerase